MVRPEKRKPSPPPAVSASQGTSVAVELLPRAASAPGGEGEDEAALIRVRRSSVAPRVTCGLCGRILRDATTVSECLHSFCWKCISQKFEDEDIKYCPTCNTNLGCSPLVKLRPEKRARTEETATSSSGPTAERSTPLAASVPPAAPRPKAGPKPRVSSLRAEVAQALCGEPEEEEEEEMAQSQGPSVLSAGTSTAPGAAPVAGVTEMLPGADVGAAGTSQLQEESRAADAPQLSKESGHFGTTGPSEQQVGQKRPCADEGPSAVAAACLLSLAGAPILAGGSGSAKGNSRVGLPNPQDPRAAPFVLDDDAEEGEKRLFHDVMSGVARDLQATLEGFQKAAGPHQRQATSVAPVPDQINVEKQANSPSVRPASIVASRGPICVQTSVQCDENLRSLIIHNENSEKILQRIDSYMTQSQVYKEVARLKEELQNTISEKNEALERTRVLEKVFKEQSEQRQIESERSQAIEAAGGQMLRECIELGRLKQFEMSEKDVELSSLKHNRTMIEKRNIQVEQRNAALVDQIDHVNRLLEAEKLNSIKLTGQLGKAVNENNKLMTELRTYNDDLSRIKGVIHAGLTATPCQLDKSLEGQAERHRTVYNWSQGTEATLRELLREHRAQKSEVSDKDEVLTSLEHNIIMIGEKSIEAKKRNTVRQDRISHASRLLEAQKQNSSESNELIEKLVNEKLKTYNDGLDIIQECIRRSLTTRISRLRQSSTMIKVGHYEDLLARINALGRVMAHLPKMLETIGIAASLSAYSTAASIFVRLRAYHGENFDLQRLLLPLHLEGQDYARIRNAVDPLAAQVAQKYVVCKH